MTGLKGAVRVRHEGELVVFAPVEQDLVGVERAWVGESTADNHDVAFGQGRRIIDG